MKTQEEIISKINKFKKIALDADFHNKTTILEPKKIFSPRNVEYFCDRFADWLLKEDTEMTIMDYFNPIIDEEYRVHNKVYRCISVRKTLDDKNGNIELCSTFKRLYTGEYEEGNNDRD